jgi:uncharacterized protein YqeY
MAETTEKPMTIQEQLLEDMKAGMKAGNAELTGVIRLLRSSMKNEQIKLGHELSDEEALKVLQREAKQRRDSVDQYNGANRPELAAVESAELEVIQGYLPAALSEADLAAIVDAVIAEQGATDMKQMGAVIGAVMQKVGAQAEGGAVSKLVREKLA